MSDLTELREALAFLDGQKQELEVDTKYRPIEEAARLVAAVPGLFEERS